MKIATLQSVLPLPDRAAFFPGVCLHCCIVLSLQAARISKPNQTQKRPVWPFSAELEKVPDPASQNPNLGLCGEVGKSGSQTLVWGKQSARLSGLRTISAIWRKNRAAARAPLYITYRRYKPIENRKRNQTLTVRLTKSEKAAITAKARKAKMNLTEYIVALSRDVTIILPPDIAPLVTELKRIGNNLNQIAARVNSGAVYVPDLGEVVEMQKVLYKHLLSVTEDSTWQR